MLVKPAEGLAPRDPYTRLRVPEEGIEVPDNDPLWNRMIADGDFVGPDTPAEPPPAPAAPPAPPAPPPRSAAAPSSTAKEGDAQ